MVQPENCAITEPNDCDGRIDEALNLGEACFRGEGDCRSAGTFVCGENGDVLCDVVPVRVHRTMRQHR